MIITIPLSAPRVNTKKQLGGHANFLTYDLTHMPFTLPKLLHVMMLKTALIYPGMMCSNLWCN